MPVQLVQLLSASDQHEQIFGLKFSVVSLTERTHLFFTSDCGRSYSIGTARPPAICTVRLLVSNILILASCRYDTATLAHIVITGLYNILLSNWTDTDCVQAAEGESWYRREFVEQYLNELDV